jgi:hypothetical protein
MLKTIWPDHLSASVTDASKSISMAHNQRKQNSMQSHLVLTSASTATKAPVARTIEATCDHYGWSRTYVFERLSYDDLVGVKAGRRTLITSESADRHFASLPRATYRPPQQASAELSKSAA